MKKRTHRDYIQDIVDAVNDTRSFTAGMGLHDFKKDRKTVNAVIRSIEVIGEATKKIPQSMREKHPAIPWRKMAGMRNKMRIC